MKRWRIEKRVGMRQLVRSTDTVLYIHIRIVLYVSVHVSVLRTYVLYSTIRIHTNGKTKEPA